MSGLLSLDEAQRRLLALAQPVEPERVAVHESAGRWLAEDLPSKRTQPPADLSAMDGYAIRCAELPGPWTIVGESAAGSPLGRALAQGEAARIFTGAAMPEGADTVLIQENAVVEDGRLLRAEPPPAPHANVRRRGEDFVEGTVLARAGDRLNERRIALAVAGGHGALPVRRRIRVALVSTGDELLPPGEPTGVERLPASNGPMLAAQLAHLPVDVTDLGIVADRIDAIGDAIEQARNADILVTIGGASVGDHDLVRPALERAGATLDFWKVAMKPGKPLIAGTLGATVVLGLPGNPVSAFVTGKLFLEPLVARLAGAREPLPDLRRAALAAALAAGGTRHEFLRGHWTADGVVPVTAQGSAALAALAEADVLISRPPGAPAAQPGEEVDILPL